MASFSLSKKLSLVAIGLLWGIIFAIFSALLGRWLAEDQYPPGLVLSLLGLFVLALLGGFGYFRIVRHSALYACGQEIDELAKGIHKISFSFFDHLDYNIFKQAFLSSSNRLYKSSNCKAKNYVSCSFLVIIFIVIFSLSPLLSFVMLGATLLFWGAPKKSAPPEQNPQHNLMAVASDLRAMGQHETLIFGWLKKDIQKLADHNFLKSIVHHNMFSILLIIPVCLGCFALIVPVLWHQGNISLSQIYATLLLGYGFLVAMKALLTSGEVSGMLEATSLRREFFAFEGDGYITKQDETKQNMIRFHDVSFAHRGEEKPLFKNVNLDISRGMIIGVVGGPLMGKSTLMHLIGGKIYSSQGEIVHFSADGAPIAIANIDDDSDLMGGPLRDVVTLLNPRIQELDILNALTKACAVDLFHNRPLGLLAPIEPHGKNLSLSEKKRVLLAQAFAQKPDLVILDDFFVALDHDTSMTIINNLRCENITAVFNSNNNAELSTADAVIFIENKDTIIVSNHTSLYEFNAHYREEIEL